MARDTLSDFATLSLDGSGLERRSRVPERKRMPDYAERFDSKTLWVDAVWRDGTVRLIAPRLNNLRRAVLGAVFALDGRSVRPGIRQYYRHAVLTLASPEKPARVSVQIGNWRGETVVHGPQDARFAGRNVLFTLSKNDDPAWIEDWVRFHVHHHGADAVAFVDNGSTRHSPDAIRAAIRRGGVETVLILSTPLRYGPRGTPPFANTELYLQTCVMNAMRWRYLRAARAVLGSDVDELIHWPGGSIFDAAARSRWGYVAVDGHWVYPAPGCEGWSWHARHSHVAAPAKPCPQKWCLVPDGPLRGVEWRVHHLERLPFAKRFRIADATLYHCRAVTTGWKSAGRLLAPEGTVPDRALCQALAEAGMPDRSGTA